MTREPVGSVAEEAAKLFAVLQNAAGSSGTTHADEPHAGEVRADDPPHEHKLGPDCVWCPICQVINKVRSTSPETLEQLCTAAAHVLGSVRSLLEEAAEAARQAREDSADEPDQAQNQTRSGVDRIDVSEDPERWD